ncbi:CbiQ family ECF transporter T component [soil metagenome]
MSGSWANSALRLVGVHRPGRSWLHRLPAGAKVAGLVVAVAALLRTESGYAAVAGLVLALAVLASAGVPCRWLAGPARAVGMMLLVVGAFQVWVLGWSAALVGVCQIGACLVLAWAVSLTTPVGQMLDLLRRLLAPIRLVGADPERVALTLAMAIRSVPLVVAAAEQADQARLARGRRRSVSALVVPTVVRSVRIADALGDALIARGYPSEPDERHTPEEGRRAV